MNSASPCSPAGRYDNPIPTRFLAPIDYLKIPAQGATFSEGMHIQKAIGFAKLICGPPTFEEKKTPQASFPKGEAGKVMSL
jgi:hypothetical protein